MICLKTEDYESDFVMESELQPELLWQLEKYISWSTNPNASKDIVADMNKLTDFELLKDISTIFNYCPICGTKIDWREHEQSAPAQV
jgi:hypothetical protein